jgi:hypothetical protein
MPAQLSKGAPSIAPAAALWPVVKVAGSLRRWSGAASRPLTPRVALPTVAAGAFIGGPAAPAPRTLSPALCSGGVALLPEPAVSVPAPGRKRRNDIPVAAPSVRVSPRPLPPAADNGGDNVGSSGTRIIGRPDGAHRPLRRRRLMCGGAAPPPAPTAPRPAAAGAGLAHEAAASSACGLRLAPCTVLEPARRPWGLPSSSPDEENESPLASPPSRPPRYTSSPSRSSASRCCGSPSRDALRSLFSSVVVPYTSDGA